MKTSAIAVTLFLVSTSGFAGKRHHKAHTHGVGSAQVLIEDKQVRLNYDIPLDSLVGFEHKPKTQVQKDALKKAIDLFNNAANFASLQPDTANCQVKSQEVKKPFAHDHDHKSKHSELSGHFEFDCQNPKQLKSISWSAFEKFPKLKTLKIKGVVGGKQFSKKATRKNTITLLP